MLNQHLEKQNYTGSTLRKVAKICKKITDKFLTCQR